MRSYIKTAVGVLVGISFVVAHSALAGGPRREVGNLRARESGGIAVRTVEEADASAAAIGQVGALGLTPEGSAVAAGLQWLKDNQNPSGSWGDEWEFADTADVIHTLRDVEPDCDEVADGADWLAWEDAANLEFLARQIIAVAGLGGCEGVTDTLVDDLLAARNEAESDDSLPNWPEGGWGLDVGYETDCMTTAVALCALKQAGLAGGFAVRDAGLSTGEHVTYVFDVPDDAVKIQVLIDALTGGPIQVRLQEGSEPPFYGIPYFEISGAPTLIIYPDSGIPFAPGTNYIRIDSPDNAGTFSMTVSYETPEWDTRTLAEPVAYLIEAQNGDGGWGLQRGSDTDLYTTLHVLLALQDYSHYGNDSEIAAGMSWLRSQQLLDGSFGYDGVGSVIETSLAALCLMCDAPYPFQGDTLDAIGYLVTAQGLNGAWNSEFYDTALAMLALNVFNQDPIADAGPDQWVYDTDADLVESVTLDGSGSSDVDGVIESYVWTENDIEIATGVSPTVEFGLGTHTVLLTVTDDGGKTATDEVVIKVTPPPETVYSADMNTDPGWSAEGLWAWGQPTGQGGSHGGNDPTSGYTGDNVYGYNLDGGYENNLPAIYLTTDAIDCTGYTDVELSFYRWLCVEESAYDHASVEVSTDPGDPGSWVTLYENPASTLIETSWSLQTYDISGVADDQPEVYIRWCMGPSDDVWNYGGWNIDDVEILGINISGGIPPVITSTPVTDATVGEPYGYDVDATGVPAPTYSLTTSPTGMTIDSSTGLIQWTPDAWQSGPNPVTVEASNSAGTDNQSFSIDVSGVAPVITSAPVINATVGEPYSYNVDATGVPAPTYSLITSPAGMTIDPSTGLIQWTPNASQLGSNPVTVAATNSVGTGSQSFNVTVARQCNVGNATVFSSVTTSASRRAVPYKMPESGTIQSISIYHEGGSGDVLLGVYAGDSAPGTRIGITAATAINSSAGWQTVNLIEPVYVEGGQNLWLAWVFENNPGIRFDSGSPGRADSGQGWAGGMPQTFGASTTANYIYSVYATYTVTKGIGNATVFSSVTTSASRRAMPYTMPESGTIQSISIYHEGGSGDVLLGVYTGDSAPNTRIGVTPATAINGIAGWQTVNLIEPVYVEGGQNLWLAWVFENNPGIRFDSGSPGRADSGQGWAGGMPDTFGSSVTANYVYSIYATYTAINAVGSTTVFSSITTSGSRRAMPYTMPEGGTIQSISIYHEGGSGDVLLGVYRGDSAPSTRIGMTPATAINGSAGWQTVNLIEPVYVEGGQRLWLAWVFENNPGIRFDSGSPGRADSGQGWAGGMPEKFGGSTTAGYIYSIYATYRATNAVGDTSVFSSITTSPNRRAVPYTMPEGGTIQSISIYHQGGSGDVLLGVYVGDSAPGTRIGITAATSINGSAGWQTVNLIEPVYVEGGQNLWLAWVFENNPGIRFEDGSPGRAHSDQGWAGGMPGTFGSSTTADYIYSVYATYRVTKSIGNTTVFSSITTSANRRAAPYTMPESGIIQSISIYHEGGSGDVLLGVYTGDSAPGTRIGVTAATAINGSAGWQTVNLTEPVYVEAGQELWLAWVFENNPGIRFEDGSPGRADSGQGWVGGMPDTFGSSTTANYIYSIYAMYAVATGD